MNPVDKRRREFVGQAAAIAGTLIAPGLMLYEYARTASSDSKPAARNIFG